MQCKVPEVARDTFRKLSEEPHHQRWTGVIRGRMDATIGEIRPGNFDREIERRPKTQIYPVGSLQNEAVTDGVSKGVGWDNDPLRAGWIVCAELSELGDEWVGQDSPMRNEKSLAFNST